MGRLFLSIELCRTFDDEDFLIFGMNSKHHLNSKNVHYVYRVSLLFQSTAQPKRLGLGIAGLQTCDICMLT